MHNNPLLMIPVETKVREFDAKLLLALIALRKGFDVVIGALWEMKYLVDLLDRGIFFDKSIAKTKCDWFRRCRQQGCRVAALDEEGLVYFDAETYRELRIYPPTMQETDVFFAWGQDQADIVVSTVGERLADRVKITGNPRFDLLRPEFRKLYAHAVEELNKKYGRFILINTSFSFANSANDPQALLQTFSQYPIAEKRPGFFQDWMMTQAEVMKTFQDVLPLVREEFPDHSIIIRPHPSEGLELWNRLAAQMGETYVVRKGGVVPWILAADVLIHWNCTTAIEARLLGVPAIAYRKIRSDLYEQPLPNACSFHAVDENSLLAMVRQAVAGQLKEGETAARAVNSTLDKHVASLQGKLAAELMVDELFVLAKTFSRKRNLSTRALQQLKRRWRQLLDRTDPGRMERDRYMAAKFPDTSSEEVQQTVDRLASCIGFDITVQVREAGRNCFSLVGQ
jgi:surface carbohydrate biosynthesis protein